MRDSPEPYLPAVEDLVFGVRTLMTSVRKASGMTQETVARKMDLHSTRLVAAIENGEDVSLLILQRYADVIGGRLVLAVRKPHSHSAMSRSRARHSAATVSTQLTSREVRVTDLRAWLGDRAPRWHATDKAFLTAVDAAGGVLDISFTLRSMREIPSPVTFLSRRALQPAKPVLYYS